MLRGVNKAAFLVLQSAATGTKIVASDFWLHADYGIVMMRAVGSVNVPLQWGLAAGFKFVTMIRMLCFVFLIHCAIAPS